jgi:putative ABC transport system permease protein
MAVVVRSTMPFPATASILRSELRSSDPALPVWGLQTMDELMGSSVAKRRFVMLLLVMFAGIALLLAALGIYGVLSYSISQRTREIGLRMALGAEGRDVLGLVLKEALMPVGIGLSAGLLASLGVSQILSNQLFHVSPTDGVTLSFVIVLLFAVALIASYLPVHRAVTVDPMQVLRYE